MVRPITYGHSKLLGLVEEMTSGEFDPDKNYHECAEAVGEHIFRVGSNSDIVHEAFRWLAEWIECPKCKGRGMYSSIVKQIGSEGDKEVDAFCWDCDGSGKIQRIDSPEFRKVRNNE